MGLFSARRRCGGNSYLTHNLTGLRDGIEKLSNICRATSKRACILRRFIWDLEMWRARKPCWFLRFQVAIPKCFGVSPMCWQRWRDLAEAEAQMQAARAGFETLLGKYLLAFADHGAEFYSGSGNDSRRAFELAMVNLANRPTLRAFEQAYETAIGAGETRAASELLISARKRWGGTRGFGLSALAAAIHTES